MGDQTHLLLTGLLPSHHFVMIVMSHNVPQLSAVPTVDPTTAKPDRPAHTQARKPLSSVHAGHHLLATTGNNSVPLSGTVSGSSLSHL